MQRRRAAYVTQNADIGFVDDERVEDLGVTVARRMHQSRPSVRVGRLQSRAALQKMTHQFVLGVSRRDGEGSVAWREEMNRRGDDFFGKLWERQRG